jgi:hypothetical protein
VLSYEALGDNVSADDVLERVLAAVPMPEIPPNAGPERRAGAAKLAPDNA